MPHLSEDNLIPRTSPPEPAFVEDEINLLELVQVLVKRKMFIIKLCTTVALIFIVYTLTLPNIYSATARVLPPQKEGGGGFSAMLGQMGGGGLAALAGGGLTGGSDLYVGILKSRSVADAVIQRLDLAKIYETKTPDDTRKHLIGAVKFLAGKDGIISISADDKDPRLAALLANTFVDELGRTAVRLNLSKARTERLFLEKRLEVVKHDLSAAEEDMKTFSQRNKVVQVDAQAKASIEGIAHLKAELASKEVQLSVLRASQTDESPEVKAMQSGIRQIQGELAQLSGNSGNEGIPSVGKVPALALEYARKMRELKTQEAIYEQLTKQYEMAKLNEAKDSSTLQVLDDAVVPLKKSKPRRSLIVILATVTAFFVAVFFVFIREYLDKMPAEDRIVFDEIRRQLVSFRR